MALVQTLCDRCETSATAVENYELDQHFQFFIKGDFAHFSESPQDSRAAALIGHGSFRPDAVASIFAVCVLIGETPEIRRVDAVVAISPPVVAF